MRLPSIFFGIVLLIYSYLRLKKILPLETLFYYITWLSLSLILIRYSQEARPYSLTALSAGMLTVEFAHHFFRNLIPISWQFIFIALLLSYSHFNGLFLAVIFSLWVSIHIIWQRQYKELTKFVIFILGITPLLIFAIHVKKYLVTLQPLNRIFNFDKIFFVNLSQSFENVLPYLGLIGILIIVTGVFYIIKNRTESTIIYLGLTLFAITLWFVIFMTIGMQKKAGWIDRYFISIIPVLTLSLSIFISEIRILQIVKSFVFILLLFIPLYNKIGMNYQINEQYREASQFIGQQITTKDILLMTHKPNLMMYLHYLQNFGRTKIDNNTIVWNEDEVTSVNCKYIDNQLHLDSKLFVFHHVVHNNYIKKLFEVCHFSNYTVIEKKFYYVNVTIFMRNNL